MTQLSALFLWYARTYFAISGKLQVMIEKQYFLDYVFVSSELASCYIGAFIARGNLSLMHIILKVFGSPNVSSLQGVIIQISDPVLVVISKNELRLNAYRGF